MPDNYFTRYLPLLIHILAASAVASAIVLLSWLLGKRKPTRAKMSPYECGMAPVGDARERFSVKFYLVAMLFILFDVEAVFLYPWAVDPARPEDVRLLGDAGVHRYRPGWLLLCMEKGRAGLGKAIPCARIRVMPLAPPITDIEQLKVILRWLACWSGTRRGPGGEVRSRRDDHLRRSRPHP